MNAKDTAAVSVTRAVTLVTHMPDLTRRRSWLSNRAFGVEFARGEKFLMVMLPVFPALSVFRLPGFVCLDIRNGQNLSVSAPTATAIASDLS